MATSRTFDQRDNNISDEITKLSKLPGLDNLALQDIQDIKNAFDEREMVQYSQKKDNEGAVIPNTFIAVWYDKNKLEQTSVDDFNGVLSDVIKKTRTTPDEHNDDTPMKVRYYKYVDAEPNRIDIEIEFTFPDDVTSSDSIISTFLENFKHLMTQGFNPGNLQIFKDQIDKHQCRWSAMKHVESSPLCSIRYAALNMFRLSMELSHLIKTGKCGDICVERKDDMADRRKRRLNLVNLCRDDDALVSIRNIFESYEIDVAKPNELIDVTSLPRDVYIISTPEDHDKLKTVDTHELVACLIIDGTKAECGYICNKKELLFSSNEERTNDWTKMNASSTGFMIYVKLPDEAKIPSQVKEHGRIINVIGDGHCFYRSIAQCLMASNSKLTYLGLDIQDELLLVKRLREKVAAMIQKPDGRTKQVFYTLLQMKQFDEEYTAMNKNRWSMESLISHKAIQADFENIATLVREMNRDVSWANQLDVQLLSQLFEEEGLLLVVFGKDYLEPQERNNHNVATWMAGVIENQIKISGGAIENIMILVNLGNTHYNFATFWGHTVINARAFLKALRARVEPIIIKFPPVRQSPPESPTG